MKRGAPSSYYAGPASGKRKRTCPDCPTVSVAAPPSSISDESSGKSMDKLPEKPESTCKQEQQLYDRVLVDAECTHDGSLKHIVKFHDWGWDTFAARVLKGMHTLPAVQLAVLTNGFRLLAPGGTLVYSTCSLTRAQNEDVVTAFIAATPTAKVCGVVVRIDLVERNF